MNVEVRFPGPCCWAVMYTCVLSSPSCELVHSRTQSPETEALQFRSVSLTTPDSVGVAFALSVPLICQLQPLTCAGCSSWAAHFLLKILGVGFPGPCKTGETSIER